METKNKTFNKGDRVRLTETATWSGNGHLAHPGDEGEVVRTGGTYHEVDMDRPELNSHEAPGGLWCALFYDHELELIEAATSEGVKPTPYTRDDRPPNGTRMVLVSEGIRSTVDQTPLPVGTLATMTNQDGTSIPQLLIDGDIDGREPSYYYITDFAPYEPAPAVDDATTVADATTVVVDANGTPLVVGDRIHDELIHTLGPGGTIAELCPGQGWDIYVQWDNHDGRPLIHHGHRVTKVGSEAKEEIEAPAIEDGVYWVSTAHDEGSDITWEVTVTGDKADWKSLPKREQSYADLEFLLAIRDGREPGFQFWTTNPTLDGEVITIKVSDLPKLDDQGRIVGGALINPDKSGEGYYYQALVHLAKWRWTMDRLQEQRDAWARHLHNRGIDGAWDADQKFEGCTPTEQAAIDALVEAGVKP